MPLDDAGGAGSGGDGHALIQEIRAAADAATAQMRKMAATASAEARLSVGAAIAMASATMLIVALLISAWACVVALGIWVAIEAGVPVWAALLTGALVNLLAAAACRLWYTRLSRNVGFGRTIGLLLGSPGGPDEHSP